MAIAGSLLIEIGANVASLQRDLNLANKQIFGFVNDTKKIFQTFGAVVGIGSFSAMMNSFVKAAAEAETQEKKLAMALRSRGVASKEVLDILINQSKELQKTNIFSDEEIQRAYRFALSIGVLPSQLDKVLSIATQVSKLYDKDLTEAVQGVSLAMEGNIRLLKRMDPALADAMKGAKTLEERLLLLEKRFSSEAQGQIDSYASKVKMLDNQWDEFKESIGNKIIPALKSLLWYQTELLKNMEKYSLAGEFEQFGGLPEDPKKDTTGILKKADVQFKKSPKAPDEKAIATAKKLADDYYMSEMAHFEDITKANDDYFKEWGKLQDEANKQNLESNVWLFEQQKKGEDAYRDIKQTTFDYEMELLDSLAEKQLQNNLNTLSFIGGYENQQKSLNAQIEKEMVLLEQKKQAMESLPGLTDDDKLKMRETYLEQEYQLEQEYAIKKAELWWSNAQQYIQASQQMSTYAIQYLLAEADERDAIGRRMLAMTIRFFANMLQQFMFEKARENIVAAMSSTSAIGIIAARATAEAAIGMQLSAAWAAYYSAQSLNPIGGQIFIPAAVAMGAATTMFGAATIAIPATAAVGAGGSWAAAAAWMAGGVLVGAMGEAAAAEVEGGGTGGQKTIGGTGGYTLSSPTEAVYEKTAPAPRGQTININVYGNIVDQDKFSRELLPSLTKAMQDGAR